MQNFLEPRWFQSTGYWILLNKCALSAGHHDCEVGWLGTSNVGQPVFCRKDSIPSTGGPALFLHASCSLSLSQYIIHTSKPSTKTDEPFEPRWMWREPFGYCNLLYSVLIFHLQGNWLLIFSDKQVEHLENTQCWLFIYFRFLHKTYRVKLCVICT